MIVERVIFFDGRVYQIEEEIFSDADHSSIYTSEDSFEEDNKLQNLFTQQNPLRERNVRTASSAPHSGTSRNGSSK